MPSPAFNLALALENLLASISNSANFQTWTGTANPTAAKAFIYFGEAPDDAALPFAVIWVKNWSYEREATGAADDFMNSALVGLQFVAGVEDSTNRQTSYQDILTRVGGVVEDVLGLSGEAGFLAVASMIMRFTRRFTPQDAASRGQDLWNSVWDIPVRP